MPEFKKISGKQGVTAALAALLLVVCAGAGWWAWTVKSRSAPRMIANLAPVESALESPAPAAQPNATLQDDASVPATFDVEEPEATAAVVADASKNSTTPGDMAQAVVHEAALPDQQGDAFSPGATSSRPAEAASLDPAREAGAIEEFTHLRTELERKKLQVEIARQNQHLQELQFAPSFPVAMPAPVVTRPAAPRKTAPRVVEIFGRGNDLQAMVDQPGKGLVAVSVGDRIGGETVMGITERGVIVGSGKQTRTLGFK